MTELTRTWTRRMWWAAAAALLAAAYPYSAGPAAYAAWRGWLPFAVVHAAYDPAMKAVAFTPIGEQWSDYCDWWSELGQRHAAP